MQRSIRTTLRRVLVYTHRWCSMVLGALFAGWFVSGVVLMYVGMPALDPAERLARAPALNFDSARVEPRDAARSLQGNVTGVGLASVGGRPVYLFRSVSGQAAMYADSGEPVAPLGVDGALEEARRFAPESRGSIRYGAYLDQPDQWTLETARLLPAHRIALGDQAGTDIYVSDSTGAVILETTTASRRWAYPGAILHWIYLTPIRRHVNAWAQFIIWISVAGTVTCVAGLVWGVWRLSPGRHYRLKRQRRHSPYAGWMWWHHWAGLLFGVFSVTWIFSGLLSMDPWDWHPSTSPTPTQRVAFAGGPFRVEGVSLDGIRAALQRAADARDAEVLQYQGHLLLATDRGVVPARPGGEAPPSDLATVRRLGELAMPGVDLVEVSKLTAYDAYYYDRAGTLPLPVVRLEYADTPHTWLYVDPARGTVLRKEERLTRLNRWLYHGLHSLDFPFLYTRRPLWDAVVIGLSAGGLALTLTTLVPAYRRARRHVRRLWLATARPSVNDRHE